MPVIDFHSHILPAIDDGSRDLETTQSMIEISCKQGVECIIATPHFYASRDRIESFLERRKHAFETVADDVSRHALQMKLGAEVAFFPGMGRADRLELLTIEDTGVLLLEMPFMPWEKAYIEEVRYMAENRGFHVILAHLERYLGIPQNRKLMQELMELPVTVQINAESLTDWKKRGKLIRMFRDGQANLLGSDCHGVHHRPPNLSAGREVLRKKLGQPFLDEMDRAGSRLLQL